jgi:hypothetical protein
MAAAALAKCAGNDVLGLARARDRVLRRLFEHGLSAQLELPAFLRCANRPDAVRNAGVSHAAGGIDKLHQSVLTWMEKHASSRPYVDSIFAYGYAKLNVPGRARALLDGVQAAVRERCGVNPAATTGNALEFLVNAYRCRVEQALAGTPADGPLDRQLLETLEAIKTQARATRGTATGQQIGDLEYAIQTLRQKSAILEPHYRGAAFRLWIDHADPVGRELAEIVELSDGTAIIARTNALFGKTRPNERFRINFEALTAAPRTDEAYSAGLPAIDISGATLIERGICSGSGAIAVAGAERNTIIAAARPIQGVIHTKREQTFH